MTKTTLSKGCARSTADWMNPGFDDANWSQATEFGTPPAAPWNALHERPIPLWKDYGLTDYARSCYSRLEQSGAALPRSGLELCEAACPRQLPIRKMVDQAHRMLG